MGQCSAVWCADGRIPAPEFGTLATLRPHGLLTTATAESRVRCINWAKRQRSLSLRRHLGLSLSLCNLRILRILRKPPPTKLQKLSSLVLQLGTLNPKPLTPRGHRAARPSLKASCRARQATSIILKPFKTLGFSRTGAPKHPGLVPKTHHRVHYPLIEVYICIYTYRYPNWPTNLN